MTLSRSDVSKLPPSAEELEGIPRWAAVAFAARNARRAQPMLQVLPDLVKRDSGLTQSIEIAIECAEHAARNALGDPIAARRAAEDVDSRTPDTNGLNVLGIAATVSAGVAASAVAAAVVGDKSKLARVVRTAFSFRVGGADSAAREDFELLRTLAKRDNWTDDSKVDVAVLGPLWHGNEPDWWPEELMTITDSPPVLRIEFVIPASIPKADADRLMGEILQRANELHHAMGGAGLSISDAEVYESEPSLIPAGSDDDGGAH